MMKRILLTAWLLVLPLAALAQSQPPVPGGTWPGGFVPTPGEWQAAWASKADYLGAGTTPCAVSGCVMTGKLTLAPSTSSSAGLNCGSGLPPASPINGDVWCTSLGMFAFINGGVVTLGGVGTAMVPAGGTGQTSFIANRPILGNGTSPLAQGTVTSTDGSTLFATATGTPVNGHCASWNNGDIMDAGGACTTGGGGGTVSAGTINQLAYYSGTGTVVAGLATCNNGFYATNGSGVPSCSTTLPSALQSSITALGTIGTGVWQGSVIAGQYGGTGVANTGKTITLGGSLSTVGAFTLALNLTANTSVTLPTSGNIPNSTGNSGGVPYYNTSSTIATSGVLAASAPMFGGGAGTAPFTGSRSGNTTEVGTVSGALVSGNGIKSDASGNLVDFGSVPASLSVADQTLSGGANVSPFNIGSVTTGTTTIDCGKSPLQTMTNNGASILSAPAADGSCIIYVLNGASAGALSFLGFTVSSNVGDALNTVNTNKFFISIVRAGGVSNYVVRALQ